MIFALDFPAKVNSFYAEGPKAATSISNSLWLDKSFSGTWTSENTSVDQSDHDQRIEALPNGPVYVSLQVYKGDVVGVVTSSGLEELSAFSLVDLDGAKRFGRLEMTAWEYVGGMRVRLATFELRHDKGYPDALYLRVTSQTAPYLPTEARLFRHDGLLPEGKLNTAFVTAAEARRSNAKNQPSKAGTASR